MRKIDVDRHYRLKKAMELLQKEIVLLPKEQPDDIDVVEHHAELEAAYDDYLQALKQLKESTNTYFKTYTSAYSCYKKSLRWCRSQVASVMGKE